MPNRGDSREDDGNAKCNGQHCEDETWGHYALQYYRRKHNYVVRPLGSQSTIFRAGGELKNQPSSDPDTDKFAIEVADQLRRRTRLL